ncbi:protein MRG1 isoform X2 [Silene latifolia]|uniref:protein MRG1 isoform X2 n=1 Tax=Silene latifolia TaxID=37657 RepID=UPI003D7853A2
MGSSNTGDRKDDSGNHNAAVDGSDSSNGGLSDPKPSLFSDGEKVLAYHGPRIYEAKVQKAEIRKKEWRYFVHYLGWNKNWDEWVGTDRLMKYTDENIQKQQELERKQGADKNQRSGRSSQAKPKGSADAKGDKEDAKINVAKGKKRKVDEKENFSAEKLVRIQMPSTLKKQLVDDWESVMQKDKLVKLPRSPNVDEVLKKYLEYRTRKDGTMTDSVAEILNGLRCYFDKALPLMLLYKKERQQYHESVTNNVSPSTIYGAEHLLRLFVKLPELLAYVNMEEDTLTQLQQKLVDLLKFLQKNQNTFFLSVYDGSKAVGGGGKGKDS